MLQLTPRSVLAVVGALSIAALVAYVVSTTAGLIVLVILIGIIILV